MERLNEKHEVLKAYVDTIRDGFVWIELRETGEEFTFSLDHYGLDSIDLNERDIVRMLVYDKTEDSPPRLEFENTGRTMLDEITESYNPKLGEERLKSRGYKFLAGIEDGV